MSEKYKAQIISVGSYLPKQIVTSDELFEEINSEQYGIPINWMSKKMGIKQRRIAKHGTPPSQLAINAAKKALKKSSINPSSIGMVLFCGIERDHPEPATAHIIQHKLGLKGTMFMT